jgi:hypothetical protein
MYFVFTLAVFCSWHHLLPVTGLLLMSAAMARVFVLKVGVLPDRVLVPLLNDRMVAKVLGSFCIETCTLVLLHSAFLPVFCSISQAFCSCQQHAALAAADKYRMYRA